MDFLTRIEAFVLDSATLLGVIAPAMRGTPLP